MAYAYNPPREEEDLYDIDNFHYQCEKCSNRQPLIRVCIKCKDLCKYYCVGNDCWKIPPRTKFSWLCLLKCAPNPSPERFHGEKFFVQYRKEDVKDKGNYPPYQSMVRIITLLHKSEENDASLDMSGLSISDCSKKKTTEAATSTLSTFSNNFEQEKKQELVKNEKLQNDAEKILPKINPTLSKRDSDSASASGSQKRNDNDGRSKFPKHVMLSRTIHDHSKLFPTEFTYESQKCDTDKKPEVVPILREIYEFTVEDLGLTPPRPVGEPCLSNLKNYDLLDEKGEWKKNKDKKDDKKD